MRELITTITWSLFGVGGGILFPLGMGKYLNNEQHGWFLLQMSFWFCLVSFTIAGFFRLMMYLDGE